MISDDSKNAFFNGLKCWENKDYIKARYWFQNSYYDDNFKVESLAKLIQIEIREGKYAQAREILNNNQDINSPALKKTYGLLENIENNFERSKKYYSECMLTPDMQYKSLLALAKLNVQTGDYDIASSMYQTIQLNPNYHIQATIGLVCLSILKKQFFDAQQYIMNIDEAKLTPIISQHYRILKTYIKYCLGELKMPDSTCSKDNGYMIYRIFNHNEKILLSHIERHKNQAQKATNGCFFKDINIKKLLLEAREIIENMNANHFEISDMYRFKLDRPIGYKGELITNDLCVVTMIGTKDIITMYPVSLSNEFDREGVSTSEKLKLKRLQGDVKR